MRRLKGLVLCGGIFCCCLAWGTEIPTIERGAQLFASTGLGTSGKSCASCHPEGARLEETAAASDRELTATINSCITGPLGGKPLDPESVEMRSLLLYLRSLSPAPQPGH